MFSSLSYILVFHFNTDKSSCSSASLRLWTLLHWNFELIYIWKTTTTAQSTISVSCIDLYCSRSKELSSFVTNFFVFPLPHMTTVTWDAHSSRLVGTGHLSNIFKPRIFSTTTKKKIALKLSCFFFFLLIWWLMSV